MLPCDAGVFFLQIGSSALTSCVIAMTGLSLTLAIGILVDVSLPWRGFITVDTGIFISIQKDISLVLDLEQDHQHEPESSNDQPQIDGADVCTPIVLSQMGRLLFARPSSYLQALS